MDDIKPTPRNKLLGLLADGLRGGLDFATNNGKNKPMKLLAEMLGVPAVASVTDKLSYGENLTTGKGFATRLKPDVFDAAMAVAPLTNPTIKLAGLLREGAGMLKGGQAMQSMAKASPMADRGAIKITPFREYLESEKKYINDVRIPQESERLIKEWGVTGEKGSDIFSQIPKNKNYFDDDGDLTDAGMNLYSSLQSNLAKKEAANFVENPKIDIFSNPNLAAKYAEWYANQKGVPVRSAISGSSKSNSKYLDVGDGGTMRFSTHELPAHYNQSASFQFGNFDGGAKKLSDIRRHIDSFSNGNERLLKILERNGQSLP
jgi:hypothetical protein